MFNRLSKIIKLATALTAVSASTILSYSNYYMIDGITNQYKDSFSI